MNARVTFSLLTWWHAGTGRGHGEQADAVVQRTPEGLPYLPGKTVKGLLRAALVLGASLESEVHPSSAIDVHRWFGSPVPDPPGEDRNGVAIEYDRSDLLEEGRFRSTPGALTFGSATLGPQWAEWARYVRAQAGPTSEEERVLPELAPLFSTFSSTRINEQGVAHDRSLRTIEVTVPMTLVAYVEGPDDEPWLECLQRSAPLLRGLGSGRNRGLGRACVTVEAV